MLNIDINSLVPVGDRLAIKEIEQEGEREGVGGLILLQTTSLDDNRRGEVIAVGEGIINDQGTTIPLPFEIGDIVIFPPYGGDEIKAGSETILLIGAANIIAKIKV